MGFDPMGCFARIIYSYSIVNPKFGSVAYSRVYGSVCILRGGHRNDSFLEIFETAILSEYCKNVH